MSRLAALHEIEETNIIILSPVVGKFYPVYSNGTFLPEGAFIGRIKILNSFYELYLPNKVSGEITYGSEEPDKNIKVGYGNELFRLVPPESVENKNKGNKTGKSADPVKAEEGFTIAAFTSGMFYRKPSPDAPSYVEEGQKIEKGNILGLIEVMKTFNHVIFKGTDSSESGIVKRIFIEDTQEVKSGQSLFLIE